jgi:putative nucleotidyltransferase with HDIG domain
LLYHCLNTAIITCGTAIKMGLSKAEVIFMTLGALYHDYGKALLNVVMINSDKISEADRREIRTHAEKAFRIFQRLNYPIETTYSIWFHHEHCDGTGYPKAVTGDKIPMGAKSLG